MTRRSPEVVDGALGFQHHGSPRDASYVWEALDILADEVRAQREVIARVEALLPAWRTETSGLRRDHDDDVSFCIADLEAALKGEP
jgi:hypothetical protein